MPDVSPQRRKAGPKGIGTVSRPVRTPGQFHSLGNSFERSSLYTSHRTIEARDFCGVGHQILYKGFRCGHHLLQGFDGQSDASGLASKRGPRSQAPGVGRRARMIPKAGQRPRISRPGPCSLCTPHKKRATAPLFQMPCAEQQARYAGPGTNKRRNACEPASGPQTIWSLTGYIPIP